VAQWLSRKKEHQVMNPCSHKFIAMKTPNEKQKNVTLAPQHYMACT
jgi:hypothetical protein